MKRIGSLFSVVGIQAAGSLATLAAVMIIARLRGPEMQGSFGLVKAEIDFLAALLLVGMPQAIFYYLNRGALTWLGVWRITFIHTAAAGVIAILIAIFRRDSGLGAAGILGAVSIGAAVAALVGHGNLRGGLLETRSALMFSLVTALPGAFLLLGVIFALLAGSLISRGAAHTAPILASAYCCACLVTAAIARRSAAVSRESVRSPTWVMLGKYGLATWVPAVTQNLSPVLALNWIDRRIGDPVGLGVFSAAVLSLNMILTPLAMLVPLLFKRWASTREELRWQEFGRVVGPMAVICFAFVCLAFLVEKPVVRQVFGPEYVLRGDVFAILSIGIWPQAVGRLFGVLFSADGRPWLSIVGELARVAALFLGLHILEVDQLVKLALVWIAAEFTAPAAGWLVAKYRVSHSAGVAG